jgi:3-mercaptopyruvate sulfurtransferase SseA
MRISGSSNFDAGSLLDSHGQHLKTDDLINLLVKDLNSLSVRPSTAILVACGGNACLHTPSTNPRLPA